LIGGASQSVTSAARSVAGEDDGGSQGASDAESAQGGAGSRLHRSAKERQAYFANQPDCAAHGPHRALCSRCCRFVNLLRAQPYAVAPWERHRAKCDQEQASDAPLPPNAEEQVNLSAAQIFGEAPARVRRTAAERQAQLLADPLAGTVEEERVWCNKCQKWIALKKGQAYDTAKWTSHRERCDKDGAQRQSAAVKPPSKPVATASVEDEGHDSDGGESVEEVPKPPMDVERPDSAPLPTAASRADSPAAAPVAGGSTVDAKSGRGAAAADAKGERSEAAANAKSERVARPLKRAREPEEDAPRAKEDERPSNRPRPASDEAHDPLDPSTALGWFLLPFHSFARGFKESLSRDDS